MVGLVIVSHSHRLASGLAELAREMGGSDVPIEIAAGLALPEHPIGTDAVLVMEAVDRAWSEDGVLVLMDLGSAVLAAEMALDLLPAERRPKILLCEAPLVEGAVAAAVTARLGAPLELVAAEARGGLAGKVAHLGVAAPDVAVPVPPVEGELSLRVTVTAPHGLHARPAARLVQIASAFDARVWVSDLSNGRGPADAASLNAVATLGATQGHEILVAASGTQAREALSTIEELAARRFDDAPEAEVDVVPARAPIPAREGERHLRGHPASPGIAIGPARRLIAPELSVPDEAGDPEREIATLEDALGAVREEIERQRGSVAARAGVAEAEIFDVHLLFLRDDAILGPARRTIEAERRSAARAWADAIEATAAAWDGLEDGYQRARAADLRSVGRQVLAHLLGVPLPPPAPSGAGVLIADDLSPADAAGLDPEIAVAVATASGGPTSHAAVIARALGIPAVVGVGDLLMGVEEGTPLAVDGAAGIVFVEPDLEEVARLEAARDAREAAVRLARADASRPAVTADGTRIEVAANIGSPVEAVEAVSAGADGVGLFRTELLFMGRSSMPDEREQEDAYRAAAEALGGRPLTVRTLDVGADKPLPYVDMPAETNPFLGVRGIRLGLERPELLEAQVRAIFRVAAEHPLRMMFPMVAAPDDLHAALRVSERAGPRPASLEIGVMIEVPSAAVLADRLARDVDFFSIGTNDLTQYTLAVDRGNPRVGELADALHPSVLRLIARTVDAADAAGRWVGVCGEIAGDPDATAILLGLGVRELSMSVPAIALVKHAVRGTELVAARTLAEEALGLASAGEVRELLDERPAR